MGSESGKWNCIYFHSINETMALNTGLEELHYCCPPILSLFNWWSIWQFWGRNLEFGIINSEALILFQLQMLPPIPPPLISEAQTLFGSFTFCSSVSPSEWGRWSSSTSPLQISHRSSSFSNTELHTISPNSSTFENCTSLQRKNQNRSKKTPESSAAEGQDWAVTCRVYELTLTSLPVASFSEWQREQTPPSPPDPRAKSSVELTSCPLSRPPPHPILNCHSSNQLAPQFWAKEMLLLEALQGKVSEWLHSHASLQGSMKRVQILCFIPPKPMNMLGIQLISGIKASF